MSSHSTDMPRWIAMLIDLLRIVRPPTPPPTCEERVHYPVFNPHDPRHNPTATSAPWIRSDYNMCEESSGSQNTASWMQSLPQRSLRKARSGLLAIRSGMRKHSLSREQSSRRTIPGAWMSPGSNGSSLDHRDGPFPSAPSEASTENEREFGVDLYRTRCNGSSTGQYGHINRYLQELPAADELTIAAIPESDIDSAGLPLEGDTLNDLSEEDTTDAELTRQSSKGQNVTWHDGYVSRVHPRSSSSQSIPSMSISTTSSTESNISEIVDDSQALQALCSLVQPTADCPTNVDVECSDDHSIPSSSKDSITSSSERHAELGESNECSTDDSAIVETKTNAEQLSVDTGNAEQSTKIDAEEAEENPSTVSLSFALDHH